jgi:hypothetical protein
MRLSFLKISSGCLWYDLVSSEGCKASHEGKEYQGYVHGSAGFRGRLRRLSRLILGARVSYCLMNECLKVKS